MKLSEWKLYSIYALGHILQGSPEADEKYLKILFKYLSLTRQQQKSCGAFLILRF